MDKLKKIIITFLLMLSLIPVNIYAYSDYITVSGKNIGIQIKTKGVMVVGLYNIDNKSPGKDAGINLGDYIIKINDKEVNNIEEMIKTIDKYKDTTIKMTYLRDNKEYNTNLNLIKSRDGVYKTGLYVKDTISGVGTLTYIDPGTKMYGALGHAIIVVLLKVKMGIQVKKMQNSSMMMYLVL